MAFFTKNRMHQFLSTMKLFKRLFKLCSLLPGYSLSSRFLSLSNSKCETPLPVHIKRVMFYFLFQARLWGKTEIYGSVEIHVSYRNDPWTWTHYTTLWSGKEWSSFAGTISTSLCMPALGSILLYYFGLFLSIRAWVIKY